MQRAAIHLDMGDYESAVADCDAVLQADPQRAAAHVARARAECELSENEKAVSDCDAAIRLDERLVEAYVIRAKARLEKAAEMRTPAEVAECQRATADCRTAIEKSKKFPGDPEDLKHAKSLCGLAHEFRGSIYYNLGATKKALAEYERALTLDPFLVSTLLRRAVTRSGAEDFAGALNDCQTAISIDSTRPEAYSGRGWVYVMKHEFPKAIEDFTQAVALDRKCAKAYVGRAIVYSMLANAELEKQAKARSQGEFNACQERMQEFRQKCIADATAAIAANRHMARAYLTRGLAYARQQIVEKALADFNAAIREDPKAVKAYYNRAVLHVKMFQLDAAAKDFEDASNLQPDEPLFDFRLWQIHQSKRDPILASKYLRQYQEKEKARKGPAGSLDDPADFISRPKLRTEAELKPDIDLDPLERAKRDLEKELDATAEK